MSDLSRRPIWSRRVLMNVSASLIAIAIATPAFAQCAPDPTVMNGTTTCAGTDTDGIQVTTGGTTLTVVNGATVTNNGAPAISVDVSPNSSSYLSNTINLLGDVSASGDNAIAISTGMAAPGVILTVAAGVNVTGTTALALLQSPGNAVGTAFATIDNAGTLTGTSGTALLGIPPTNYGSTPTHFSNITNRASGSIVGGIIGSISTLSNAGSIDGGTGSAVTSGYNSYYGSYQPSITNVSGGVIRSTSSAATIVTGPSNTATVANSGAIVNMGSGAALSGGSFTITNQAGGLISSVGTTAITAASLNLVNQGTITGDIVISGGGTVDSTGGVINGAVTFGDGYDTLIARYAGSPTLVTGINGAIDGGGGVNIEKVVFTADTSVTTPINLATNFQTLALAPVANVTATLDSGFSISGGLMLDDAGTVVNRVAIAGPVTDLYYGFGSSAEFRNEGSITTSSTPSGVALSNHSLTNTGTITATGGTGVNMSYNPVNNAGSITASGTGVYMFDGVLTNSGDIVSTAGDGVYLIGNAGYTAFNSGTIRGATTGATTYIYLTNSGTIGSDGVGVAVQPYGYLINTASGVINGGRGGAVLVNFNAGVANAGTINGDVSVNGAAITGFNTSYIAIDGSVLNGNLTLNGATLVTSLVNRGSGQFAGINGTVTADSTSMLRYAVNTDTTATLPAGAVGPFTRIGYQLDNGAKLTLNASSAEASNRTLLLAGNGAVDVNATIAMTGMAAIQSTTAITYPGATPIASGLTITSRGTLSMTSTADSGSGMGYLNNNSAVYLSNSDSFTNAGTINLTDQLGHGTAAIYGGASATNSGRITLDGGIGIANSLSANNTGSITQALGGAVADGVTAFGSLTNTGTINVGGSAARITSNPLGSGSSITNAGALISTGGIAITTDVNLGDLRIDNQAGGMIAGIGTAIRTYNAKLTNAGTITGTVDIGYGGVYNLGSGSIYYRSTVSSTYTAAGGTLTGDLLFGDGWDTFTLGAASTGVSGIIDGGAGTDTLLINTSVDGAVSADQFHNFEQVTQTGSGTVAYSGAFTTPTIALNGGGLRVAVGQTLATQSATTITGGAAGVSVDNAGTIAGAVMLGIGNDSVVNTGTITGLVTLGAGDDSYTEGANSTVAGAVDGGAGIDTYRVRLAGDRAGLGPHVNFEQLGVEGSGTLSLILDQDFQAVLLNGAGLNLSLNGHVVGPVTGGDGADAFSVDGDVALVSLGAGNDLLAIGAQNATGHYDGGAGTDLLRFTAGGPITLSGTATGFETLSFADGHLAITGMLGAPGDSLTLSGGGDKTVILASGGTIAGMVDLGPGNDNFTLAAGGVLSGSVSGGAGVNSATLMMAGDTALGGLANFQSAAFQGSGTVTFTGASTALEQVSVPGDVVVAAGASLSATRLVFGSGDDRLTVDGVFSGSVDGGAGNDLIEVSGGSPSAPASFRDITNVETFAMRGGYATISGTATFPNLSLTGGRLVGLASSTISTPQINVGVGATFGSAGTVNGNITVAGTLSPGASPGTMTVNGNVSLASGSLSLFEVTPTVSDKLVVNGVVSIASGATLQLAPSDDVKPGMVRDLIVASGGINGSFTNIVKPESLIGIVVQQGNTLEFLGQFAIDPSFTPQIGRSIAYLNSVIAGGRVSAPLLAALPSLASNSGVSNAAAFRQITPEAYASARQIAVENGLTLAGAARGEGLAGHGDTPALYSFGEGLGNWRGLSDNADGVSSTQTNIYGMIGGLGWGDSRASGGAFVGYLNGRQRIGALGARTSGDGIAAGVHGRFAADGWIINGTIAYNGGNAVTRRPIMTGNASGRYRLRGWTGDLAISYTLPLGANWTVQPTLGGTIVRSSRQATAEGGDSPFALSVRGETGTAAFVDAGAMLRGGVKAGQAVRPMLSLGMRYQASDRRTDALADLDGASYGLLAEGSRRALVVATGALGFDADLAPTVVLFGSLAGERSAHDHNESARLGLRIRL